MPTKDFREPLEPLEIAVVPEEVVAYLATLSQPASIREIAHGMNYNHRGRRYLPRVLNKLVKKHEVEEVKGGRYRIAGAKQAQSDKAARAAQKSRDRSAQAKATAAAVAGAAGAQVDEASQSAKPEPQRHQKPERGRDPNLISGRLIAHRDGYGFVLPDAPIPRVDGDLFIGRDGIGDAMNGDKVLARVERRRNDGRAEGRIVQVVRREHPTVVGLFRYGPNGNVVLPYDARILHEIAIPSGAELTPALRTQLAAKLGVSAEELPQAMRRTRLPELDGAVVDVELVRFPKSGLAPSGKVLEILGRPGEMGVDVEIIIRKHHLPHVFGEDVMAQAHAAPQTVSASQLEGRRDFRELPIVTIDGETARDFDDAVLVTELDNGHYELQVHIADVAHYVQPGTPLDREARLRGTSVYFPNRAVPMLPEELSNGICSLNPKLDRLVMSAVMEMDATGEMVRSEFAPGVIRSAERMTYTNVTKVLEGDAEMTARYKPLVAKFKLMKKLAELRIKLRHERGSIDFDLPEPVIEFDDSGRMTKIIRSERNIAHRLIEEFMLAANEAVAQYLEKRAVASLHRVHEKPDPKKVIEFEELAHAFGYSLGVDGVAERRIVVKHTEARSAKGRRGGAGRGGRERRMEYTEPAVDEVDIRPQHYQNLAAKIAGTPEERILSYLMLRSLKQARYTVDVLGHFALAAKEYTHFTSPIRRYPDLIVHRALKWALAHPNVAPVRAAAEDAKGEQETVATLGPYRRNELKEVATESSAAERGADMAERDLMDWKTAQFMEQHLGDEYEALIISIQKFGFFVELMEIFVEGLVSIDRIEEFTGRHCEFRERDHTIVSEGHRTAKGSNQKTVFRLGDRVRVRAERIDPVRHKVEFALLEITGSATSKKNREAQ
jgi:ribonuclease R